MTGIRRFPCATWRGESQFGHLVEPTLLAHAGDSEGLLSWRRLVAEYEPATAGGKPLLLLEVLAQTLES